VTKRYIACNDENNGYAYNMSKTFFQWEKVFPEGRIPPPSYRPGHQMVGMQKWHCRLDWYVGMYGERLLVHFILDILKSSLVGLDNSA